MFDVEERHGSGEKIELSKDKLSALQRVCDKFRKMMETNCTNYALYRCNLTSQDNMIYAVLTGASYEGNVHELQFGVSMVTGEVFTEKIKVNNGGAVGKELYNLVVNLNKLVPFTVGMLDFPIEGKFEKGFQMEYNKESGTALIIIKDSLDNSYFLY